MAENSEYSVSRGGEDVSVFDDFSRQTDDMTDMVRTNVVWERDLFNGDAYEVKHAMFKYGDVIYVCVYKYGEKDNLHFRRFNALTGEPLDGSDENLIAITLPEAIKGVQETSGVTGSSGSWLRFVTDDKGEIGLCRFEREKGNSEVKLDVYQLFIDETFNSGELKYFRILSRTLPDIFGNTGNYISDLFQVSGDLYQDKIAFDFLVFINRESIDGVHHLWYHFDSESDEVTEQRLMKFYDGEYQNFIIGQNTQTITPVEGGRFLLNTSMTGSWLIDEMADFVGDSYFTGYRLADRWMLPDGETQMHSLMFQPVNLFGEEYYITSCAFPEWSDDTNYTNVEQGSAVNFSLYRWRDKSSFTGMEKMLTMPQKNFTFNYGNCLRSYQQHCLVEYVGNQREQDEEMPEEEHVGLSFRSEGDDSGLEITEGDETNEEQTADPVEEPGEDPQPAKAICYIYSPSAGIARYDFEAVKDYSATALENVVADEPVLSFYGIALTKSGSAADLVVSAINGSVVLQKGACSEVSVENLQPGCYIVKWGNHVTKIIKR